jgi:hypothetical protein
VFKGKLILNMANALDREEFMAKLVSGFVCCYLSWVSAVLADIGRLPGAVSGRQDLPYRAYRKEVRLEHRINNM